MNNNKTFEERLFRIECQKINLERFDCDGWVLDIGGGGEGIIGQLLGDRVVAIDPSKNELEEAVDGPLKIIMDARGLTFLDNTFNTVTAFFTMMYISMPEHKKVFQEIYRVMKSGSIFIFWDVVIPPFNNGEKDIFVVPLEIKIEDKIIETGYGTLWSGREQDLSYYSNIGKEVGFEVISEEVTGQTYCLKFRK